MKQNNVRIYTKEEILGRTTYMGKKIEIQVSLCKLTLESGHAAK